LIAHNGVTTLYDVTNGKRIRPIPEEKIGTVYTIEAKLKSENSKWTLQYWMNGRLQETIVEGVSYPLALSRKNQCSSTHKNGCLLVVKHVG